MKLTTRQDVLAAVTGWATSAARIGKAPQPSPVLSGLLLTADADGTLSVAGYDYDTSAQARLTCAEVGEPGRALIGARMLAQVAASLPAGYEGVTITTDGTRAVITAGPVTYTLMLLPDGDFPALPEPGAPVAEFGADYLVAAVAQALTAASHDDTLPALCCVHLTLDGTGTATLAATDRYRLAVITCPYTPPGDDGPPGPVLIPARELAAAVKPAGAATITLGLDAGDGTAAYGSPGRRAANATVGFTSADRQVTIRPVAAEFPRYTTLIPGETSAYPITATVTADLPVIIEAVKRAAVVAPDKMPVRLAITPGEIRFDAGTGDEAGYTDLIPAQLDGDPADITFSPRYLLDALTAVAATGATAATLAITTPVRPALITPAEPAGPVTCRHVLMPIRSAG